MQHIDSTTAHIPDAASDAPERAVHHRRDLFQWRYLLILLLVVSIVLLAIVPPLLNVNRFKRRIVVSISASIGRPVHLDNVSLILLPFPGFKLENFLVEEDPTFGAEPVIHANSVVATLRFSSLWRRKVEFSRISLQEPSINLVRMPSEGSQQGRWNVESILLQAARISAAPTAQVKAGPEPRFPYIQATGARVNIKYGDEKLPFSLTEADFALWLPRPQQWHIRLEAKPTRTDTRASDTGTVSLEGTLDRAESFNLIPIDLAGEWKSVPLGEASRVVIGRDAGLRGDLRLNVAAKGTIGSSVVKSSVQLRGARLAEFFPPQTIDLRAECQATATNVFRAFHQIRCSWPPPNAPSTIALTADLADPHKVAAAPFEVGTPGLPVATLLDWLRVASPRVSPELNATGTVTGSITHDGGFYSGRIGLKEATLTGGPVGDSQITVRDLTVTSEAPSEAPAHSPGNHRNKPKPSAAHDPHAGEFVMTPATLTLGAKEPALLEGRFDRNGYTLHLTGNVLPSRLLALANAIPQFGDGLMKNVLPVSSVVSGAQTKDLPIHVDLTSTRLWGGGQSWAKTPAKVARSTGERRP